MDKVSNQQIIEQMYKDYEAGNISAVFSFFDKDIVWVRPGAPDIPFSGTFNGIDEVIRMFTIQAETLTVTSFVPEKICTNEDTVVVLGNDTAIVKATGKTYSEEWVQAFTFKNGKIIYVQVYIDTKMIAEACLP